MKSTLFLDRALIFCIVLAGVVLLNSLIGVM